MAPGPSSGWTLVFRILKAGRHKAARTLKVADKADEIDHNTNKKPLVLKGPVHSCIKQNVSQHALLTSTPLQQVCSDNSSNRSQQVKSVLQALGFAPLSGHRYNHGGAQTTPACLLTTYTPVQCKPFLISLLGHKSRRAACGLRRQTWQINSTASMRGFSQKHSIFTFTPETMPPFVQQSALLLSDDKPTSQESPHLLQPNKGSEEINCDTTHPNSSGITAGAQENHPSRITAGFQNQINYCNDFIIPPTHIDLQQLTYTENDKETLSRNSSFSSTTSSIQFDSLAVEATENEFSLEMVVTGMEPCYMMREERSTSTILQELKPEERTLLKPDVKSF